MDLYCEYQWQRSRKEYNYPGQHTAFFFRFLPSRIFGTCCIFHTVCHRISYGPPLPHYAYLFLFLTEVCPQNSKLSSFPHGPRILPSNPSLPQNDGPFFGCSFPKRFQDSGSESPAIQTSLTPRL